MRFAKSPILVISAIFATTVAGFGQIQMNFGTDRVYRQSQSAVDFRKPGGMFVHLSDGTWAVAPCPLNKAPAWFAPNPACPTGATGYIASGDVGGAVDDEGNEIPDGVRDDFSYWEVTSVNPYVGIEPSHPDRCSLYSRPPSTLPTPLSFIDNTVIIYFDLMTESIREYKFTRYDLTRSYNTRVQMDSDMVTGQYSFLFPRRLDPYGPPVQLAVDLQAIPEGYIEKNNVRQGLRFTKLNGNPIRWTADGYVEMDPRLVNTIEWFGNNSSNIFGSSDIMHFSISDLGPGPGDPTRDEVRGADGRIVSLFPRFTGTPGVPRVLLPHALTQTVSVPPGFIPLTNPPAEGVVRLELHRNVASTVVTADTSSRIYQLPVRFVDTYEGWAALVFPIGTPNALRARTADPDGDNRNNESEWLAKTNPMDPNSHPAPPRLAFVPTSEVPRSQEDPTPGGPDLGPIENEQATSGYWEIRYPMALSSPATEYEFEFSNDLMVWMPVAESGPNWIEIREPAVAGMERDPDLIVRSKSATISGPGFFRVRITGLPDTTTVTALPLK